MNIYIYVNRKDHIYAPESSRSRIELFDVLFPAAGVHDLAEKTKQVRLKRKPHPGKPEHHCSSSTLLATLDSLCNMSFYPRVWVFQQAFGHRADEPHGGGC